MAEIMGAKEVLGNDPQIQLRKPGSLLTYLTFNSISKYKQQQQQQQLNISRHAADGFHEKTLEFTASVPSQPSKSPLS